MPLPAFVLSVLLPALPPPLALPFFVQADGANIIFAHWYDRVAIIAVPDSFLAACDGKGEK